MRQLFITAIQHRTMLKALLILGIVVAVVVTVVAPNPVLAGPDASGP